MNRFLNDSRRRLNQIIMVIHLAKVMGWAGAAGALVITAARVFGWTGAVLSIWLIITGMGGLAGLVMSWRLRLDMGAVARWVDEYQNNAEAYSAALVCLERNCSEPLDDWVVERAETLAGESTFIRRPTRYLIRKAAITGGVLLAALAIVLWNPTPIMNISQLIFPKQMVDVASGNFQQSGSRLEQQQNGDRSGVRTIILQKQESPVMGFVLWGKNGTIPLAQVLPDFQRTAKAALTENKVPSEYDNFVQAYFLELSREIKGNLPESEGQK